MAGSFHCLWITVDNLLHWNEMGQYINMSQILMVIFLAYSNSITTSGKKIFSWWWRHRWRHMVTSKSSLHILYKRKHNILRDNWKTKKDIIFKLGVHMYHEIVIVNMLMWIYTDDITDDVIRFQDTSKLWTSISPLIFETERRFKSSIYWKCSWLFCWSV